MTPKRRVTEHSIFNNVYYCKFTAIPKSTFFALASLKRHPKNKKNMYLINDVWEHFFDGHQQ